MKKEELKNRLDQLEHREFLIHMSDHWTQEDKKMLNEIRREIREIKEKIKGEK